jgi:membrane associated rhomboid family serine protease
MTIAAGAGDENPLLERYKDWASRTHFVTRSVILCLFGLYTLAFIAGIDELMFANIPLFVVYRLELYRIILSPWFEPSFLSLLFIWLSFQGIGRRLEEAVGSAGLLIAIITLATVTNVLFVVSCICFEISGISPGAMKEPSVGFWTVVLGLIVLECSLSPDAPRRLFPLNVEVPIKYFPWVLLVMFSLFFGVSFAHLLGVCVGYLYTGGHLYAIQPDSSYIIACESHGWLLSAVQQDGYITHGSALFPSVALRGNRETNSGISAVFTASPATDWALPFTQVQCMPPR